MSKENVLRLCLELRTSKEILDCWGKLVMRNIIAGSVSLGLLTRTIPDNPNGRPGDK